MRQEDLTPTAHDLEEKFSILAYMYFKEVVSWVVEFAKPSGLVKV